MSDDDFVSLVTDVRERIRIQALEELVQIKELESDIDPDFLRTIDYALALNNTPIALVLGVSDSSQDRVIISGGGISKVEGGEKLVEEGYQPYFRLDLRLIGKLLGFRCRDSFLQVWVSGSDWGQGKIGVCTTDNINEVDIAEACRLPSFDFCDTPNLEYCTMVPIGRGCLTTSILEYFEMESIGLEKTKDLIDEIDETYNGVADGLLMSLDIVGGTESDCFSELLLESTRQGGVWLPLAKLSGPNDDAASGIVDQYAVFYKPNGDTVDEFKVLYHRFRY